MYYRHVLMSWKPCRNLLCIQFFLPKALSFWSCESWVDLLSKWHTRTPTFNKIMEVMKQRHQRHQRFLRSNSFPKIKWYQISNCNPFKVLPIFLAPNSDKDTCRVGETWEETSPLSLSHELRGWDLCSWSSGYGWNLPLPSWEREESGLMPEVLIEALMCFDENCDLLPRCTNVVWLE